MCCQFAHCNLAALTVAWRSRKHLAIYIRHPRGPYTVSLSRPDALAAQRATHRYIDSNVPIYIIETRAKDIQLDSELALNLDRAHTVDVWACSSSNKKNLFFPSFSTRSLLIYFHYFMLLSAALAANQAVNAIYSFQSTVLYPERVTLSRELYAEIPKFQGLR